MEEEPEVTFKGTLEVSPEHGGQNKRDNEVLEDVAIGRRQSEPEAGSHRERTARVERSASTVSQQQQQVPLWRSRKLDPMVADRYFANRADRLQRANRIVSSQCVDEQLDGKMLTSLYVLTEIDNWNHDRERVVAVNQRSILVINYNFITEKWSELKRMLIKEFTEIIMGPLVYPSRTLLSPRQHECVKIISQGAKDVSGRDLWSVNSSNLPWTVLTSHPLANKMTGSRGVYQIETFHDQLCKATAAAAAPEPNCDNQPPRITQGPIQMSAVLGLSSIFVNQSNMAYAMDRNGVCF